MLFQNLFARDMVQTEAQSRAAILLRDETQLKLGPNSSLELKAISPAKILKVKLTTEEALKESAIDLLKGKLWLRTINSRTNMRVNTPTATAAIRGTDLGVEVPNGKESYFTVLEGSILLSNPWGQITVNGGEQGIAFFGRPPTKRVILAPEDAVQWTLYYPRRESLKDFPFITNDRGTLEERIQKARASLMRVELSPSPPAGVEKAMLTLGQCYYDLGEMDKAKDFFSRVLKASPRNSEALEGLGWIGLSTAAPALALSYFNQIPFPSERVFLGKYFAFRDLEKQGDAEKTLEDGLKIHPKSALIADRIAFSAMLAGEPAKVIPLLENTLKYSPDYVNSYVTLSNLYLTQNKKKEAMDIIQKAIKLNPGIPSPYVVLSLLHQSYFDLDSAEKTLDKALTLDPENIQSLVNLARLKFGSGNNEEALHIIEQARKLAPDDADILSLQGFILLGTGRTEEAMGFFRKASDKDSTFGEPHMGLGLALFRKGKYEEGILELLTATLLEPRISLYQSYLGKSYFQIRRFDEALRAFHAAKRLDTRDPTPYLYTAHVKRDLHRHQEAFGEIQQALKLNNNRAVFRSRFLLDKDEAAKNVSLAEIYRRLGFTKWGEAEALKAMETDPANSAAHLFLADLYLDLPDRNTAAGSEILQTQTLIPINQNSFNTFNDYTSLLEVPTVESSGFNFSGNYGSQENVLLLRGGTPKLTFWNFGKYEGKDGIVDVKKDRDRFINQFILKYSLTPTQSLTLPYSLLRSHSGLVDDQDTVTFLDPSSDKTVPLIMINPSRSVRLDNGLDKGLDRDDTIKTEFHRIPLLYHNQLWPGSDIVGLFAVELFDFQRTDPDSTFIIDPKLGRRRAFPGLLKRKQSANNLSVNAQLQHQLKFRDHQLFYGVDSFWRRTEWDQSSILSFLGERLGQTFPLGSLDGTGSDRSFSFYFQDNWSLWDNLILYMGARYDYLNDYFIGIDRRVKTEKLNPFGGFRFDLTPSTTLRFSYIRALETHLLDRFFPSNVAGNPFFLNNFSSSMRREVTAILEQRVFGRAFFSTSISYRDLDIPDFREINGLPFKDFNNEYDLILRGALNLVINKNFSFFFDYTFDRSYTRFFDEHDQIFRTGVNFIHESGWFIRLTNRYYTQRFTDTFLPIDDESFPLFDLNIKKFIFGRKAEIRADIKNLFDRDFKFVMGNFDIIEDIFPRMTFLISVRFTL